MINSFSKTCVRTIDEEPTEVLYERANDIALTTTSKFWNDMFIKEDLSLFELRNINEFIKIMSEQYSEY